MKQNYTITLSPKAWQKLEDMARERDLFYRGKLSRAAVIEQLVLSETQPTSVPQAQSLSMPTPTTRRWRLSEIVASWPDKEQAKWQQDEWKCKRWLQLALDTINGA